MQERQETSNQGHAKGNQLVKCTPTICLPHPYDRLFGGNRMRYARRIVPGREIVIGRKPRFSLIEASWLRRAAKYCAGLSREVKGITKLSTFKSKLKVRVKQNVEI